MTTTMTLADLAATSLSAIRILEQHGLDYCCGGKQPFEEACLAKGVKPQTIIREIEEATVASVAGRDWQTAPLDELVKHIVGTHHEYLKLDLPVLGHRLDKVVSVHGVRDPEVLPRMAEVFAALRAEMEMHMHKDVSAGDALGEIRTLTNDFELSPYACSTVKALYEGLQVLEADLHVHIHLENNILFPRAIALEKR